MALIKTERNKDMLAHEGHLYYQGKQREIQGVTTIYWRCKYLRRAPGAIAKCYGKWIEKLKLTVIKVSQKCNIVYSFQM